MGIKSSFNTFLREKCPEIFGEIHISEYAYSKIAIDISLYLNKYKATGGDEYWKKYFIKLISSLRRNQIHCVFIFDGKSPPEKEAERLKRKQERAKLEKNVFELESSLEEYYKTGIINESLVKLYNSRKSKPSLLSNNFDINWVEEKIKQKRSQLYQIYPEDYESIKELFNILDIPYYTAPLEAEKMCAKLNIDGLVDAVLSEDTDVMAYSTPHFLSKIDTNNDTCIRIKKECLLKSLDFNEEEFLDFCIMCGTDYNNNIPKIGSKTSFKHITKFRNIENFNEKTNTDVTILNHNRVRELFIEFEDYHISNIPYCGHPDFDKLKEYAEKNHICDDAEGKFSEEKFEKLKKDFKLNILVFEDEE
jgi:5'-3' exonuclease